MFAALRDLHTRTPLYSSAITSSSSSSYYPNPYPYQAFPSSSGYEPKYPHPLGKGGSSSCSTRTPSVV